jgi:hypothetical protein
MKRLLPWMIQAVTKTLAYVLLVLIAVLALLNFPARPVFRTYYGLQGRWRSYRSRRKFRSEANPQKSLADSPRLP